MQFAYGARRQSRAGAATVVLATVAVLALVLSASAGAAGLKKHSHAKKADSPSISSINWGTAHNATVKLFTLKSGNGLAVKITNYGGVVQSIWAPGRGGKVANVALGFSKLSDYVNDFENQPWPASGGSGDTYFGGAIGRYANRIANHSFTLNGITYELVGNNGPNNINTLHGGPDSWNTAVWTVVRTEAGKTGASLVLQHVDPDGYNGFPGQVTVQLTYTVTAGNALQLHWSAVTTKPTVINVTSHIYFNLAGEGSGPIYNQELRLNSNTFTPTDANLIPTGQFVNTNGTPFDFSYLHPFGKFILDAFLPWGSQLTAAHGYDQNWVLHGAAGQMKWAATAVDPRSGREVVTYTTEPGIQIYSGNFLVGDLVGTSGHIYRQTSAFTLETQHYPDSPHHIGQADWPTTVLNPGQTFTSATTYQFKTS